MRYLGSTIFSAILITVIGALITFFPVLTEETIMMLIIIGILVYGIDTIVHFCRDLDVGKQSYWDLIIGIVITIFGGYLLFDNMFIHAIDATIVLPLTTASLLLVGAVVKIPALINYYDVTIIPTWIYILNIVVSIILAILLFANPFVGGISLTVICGIYIMIMGIVEVISLIYIHHKTKEINQI